MSLSDFQPIGFYSAWGCFEFVRDEAGEIVGSRKVEGWSGEGNGFSWEIGPMTDEEIAEMDGD